MKFKFFVILRGTVYCVYFVVLTLKSVDELVTGNFIEHSQKGSEFSVNSTTNEYNNNKQTVKCIKLFIKTIFVLKTRSTSLTLECS